MRTRLSSSIIALVCVLLAVVPATALVRDQVDSPGLDPRTQALISGQTDWFSSSPAPNPPAGSFGSTLAIAYDSSRLRVVLFGGGGTWEWDGNSWAQLASTTSPSPRTGHAMVYDSAHGRTVLFGGVGSSGYLADTWEWDGTTWVQRFPATSPPPRYWHAMAYDSARGRTVLFGGCSGTQILGDTWEWDGTTWVQRFPATSPPFRDEHAMVYDSARGRTVLFGGSV